MAAPNGKYQDSISFNAAVHKICLLRLRLCHIILCVND